MKTLALDTAHQYLTLALIEDDQLIDSLQVLAIRQQSELIMVEIDQLFKKNAWQSTDLKAVLITIGPGSYTGLRIAMTIAKVLATVAPIEIYTLSTLELLAGMKEHCAVALDARSQRVYFGIYHLGECVMPDQILSIEQAKKVILTCTHLMGNGSLLAYEDDFNYIKHFVDLRKHWVKVESIHTLAPIYLKTESDYQV
jgi:tRNA threonylcarbamoyladenosine biosynthesis protein TsaB